jgi:hypothetical protein
MLLQVSDTGHYFSIDQVISVEFAGVGAVVFLPNGMIEVSNPHSVEMLKNRISEPPKPAPKKQRGRKQKLNA